MSAAIVMRGVTKHFRKHRVKREYTTLKTELVRLLTGKRAPDAAPEWIEVLNGVDLEVPKGRTLGVVLNRLRRGSNNKYLYDSYYGQDTAPKRSKAVRDKPIKPVKVSGGKRSK